MPNTVRVFSPATIANVGCGFDILGLSLHQPGDELLVKKISGNEVILKNNTSVNLPLDPEKNVAGVAVNALLDTLEEHSGFEISFIKKISPGSGVGSSAASAAGAVFAVNELLGRPYTRNELVEFAMQGEYAATGVAHADNVSPALLGGFTIIRSYEPLDIIKINAPESLFCAVVHPAIEIKTRDSRAVIPVNVTLDQAIAQWGNVAGLVAGLMKKDYELIGRSLKDVIIEPARAPLIPGFYKAKESANDAGALGFSISGSGPSVFALCQSKTEAFNIAEAIQNSFKDVNIQSRTYVSKINNEGVCVI